jgi:uncharacterized protein (UPF0332 family)
LTSEQAALIKKAQESLRAARLLAKDTLYNFAASRAYYAMFYVAQAFLLEEKLAYSKHSAVISAFGQRFAKTGRVPASFHRYLIEAQESRNIGDYDTGPGLSRDEAAEQIVRAKEFIGLAKRSFRTASLKKRNKPPRKR